MELSTTRHRFVRKLLIISKQCNKYRETTVRIMRRTIGSVVQSMPFLGANRDDDGQLHSSGLHIPIAPILDRKFSSPLEAAWGNFADKKTEKQENTKKTQENKPYRQTVDLKRNGVPVLHHLLPDQTAWFGRYLMLPTFAAAASSMVSQTPREQRLVLE